ncbi:HAESA-like 2 [Hibiscus trionum]|uniref:HAESA-like 2 n=1 Tax=Hibiscus trionum TaxID=183268 RepID=A0A9W7J4Y6_HIBTR|nr:HAESA-like 2 [Hibiscus trionum]
MRNPNFKTFLFCVAFASPFVVSFNGDSQILSRVKNFQLHDPNGKLHDWVVSTPNQSPCNWIGIICEARNHTVILINLYGFEISGGFSFEFCRIQTLRILSLADNNFNGSLSSQAFSPCIRLRKIDLSENLFIGELPDFSSENLEVLQLSNNNFSGDIPSTYWREPGLKPIQR